MAAQVDLQGAGFIERLDPATPNARGLARDRFTKRLPVVARMLTVFALLLLFFAGSAQACTVPYQDHNGRVPTFIFDAILGCLNDPAQARVASRLAFQATSTRRPTVSQFPA